MDLLSGYDMLSRDLIELDRRVLDDLRQLRHLIQIEIQKPSGGLDADPITLARKSFFQSLVEREHVAAKIVALLVDGKMVTTHKNVLY